MSEEILWKGHPSQVTNLKLYIICGLTCWLVVPIFIALWKWYETKCFTYELTTQRMSVSTGVFSRKTDDLELYRIKDTALVEPFFLRMFSLGNVVLTTSDRSTPELVIHAIPNASELREQIREHVEVLRDKKRVREVDFE